jgi:phenylacetate-CoA ligase
MYPDQRKRLQQIFPGVKVFSIGYASVDAGLIGYVDQTCRIDEHRAFGSATTLEIVDEDTLEPIEEPARPGKVLLTNLIRSLMPIIRYPVGDRAMWVEPQSHSNPDRKYMLLGRSEEAARVGPVSVYYEDMRAVLSRLDLDFQITAFQLVVRHFDLKDSLTVRIATRTQEVPSRDIEERIISQFGTARAMFAEAVADNKIHPLAIEWSDPSQVEINSRTGKLKRVIDQRC